MPTEYRPRINLGDTAQLDERIRYLSDRTGLNEGELRMVQTEMRDAVIFFNRAGRGVKLEACHFTAPALSATEREPCHLPKVGLDGTFDVSHHLGHAIKNVLNSPGTFTGSIKNRDNIGKTSDDLVAIWDEEHPEDPVV